jgi:hypothetical protein
MMKNNKMLTGVLMSVAMATPVLAANSATIDTVEKTSKQAISKQEKKQNDLLATVDQSVLDAFKQVQSAVKLLQADGKEKEALVALEKAVGQFDTITAVRPQLSLVPIYSDVEVTELITTPEMIKLNTELAIDLLKNSSVVAARELLIPMQDNLISTTAYLPIATYPDAIKLAAKALVNEEKHKSLDIIAEALSTVVVKKSVLPLGLIRAEERLKVAAKLDKEKDKAQIKTLLTAASDDLEVAKLLGYTDKENLAYENIVKQIKAIQKEVEGKNIVEKMYDKIASSFKELIDIASFKNTKKEP